MLGSKAVSFDKTKCESKHCKTQKFYYHVTAITFLKKLLFFKVHHYLTSDHCVKFVRTRSYSGPHFSYIFLHLDWIRRDTRYLSVFSPNAGKCEKNAGKMRARITPNMGNFYTVDVIQFTDHYLERKKIGTNGKQHF